MKLLPNIGNQRVLDEICGALTPECTLDVATQAVSIFGLAALLPQLSTARLLLPTAGTDLEVLGGAGDRAARNRLEMRVLAERCEKWIEANVSVRSAAGSVPQGAAVVRAAGGAPRLGIVGSFALTSDGLGLTPGHPMSLIQASESDAEAAFLAGWFQRQWDSLSDISDGKRSLIAALRALSVARAPQAIYATVLHHLFPRDGDELDEDRIVNAATGIRDTVVWRKLYRFHGTALWGPSTS